MRTQDTQEDNVQVEVEENEYTDDTINIVLTSDVQFCTRDRYNHYLNDTLELSPELARKVGQALLDAAEEVE